MNVRKNIRKKNSWKLLFDFDKFTATLLIMRFASKTHELFLIETITSSQK